MTFKCSLQYLIVCRFTLPFIMIFTQKSACFVLFYRFATSIDITSPLILKSLCVCPPTLISPTSCQVQQISTFYASLNSLVFIFYKRFFYILSDVLAYIQDFLLNQDCVYVYENVMKQVRIVFGLGSIFASGLVKTIKKNKSWALAS